jgi:hypothetical protein
MMMTAPAVRVFRLAVEHASVEPVVMVVMVMIEGNVLSSLAEQIEVAGIAADIFGVAGAAEMAVDTDHPIRR